ncbi:MAG: Integrase catalytic region [Pseudonocardiales bacterium]|nr:Integrase catalytic region [Pseudonocardiales bacterium]
MLATDFFTVDLLDGTTACVLAVIEHATRRIRVLGVTAHPSKAWVTQQARNLLMDLDERAGAIKCLLRDRDTKFTAALDAVLTASGIRILQSPVHAPARTRSWNVGSVAAAANCSTHVDLEPTTSAAGPPRLETHQNEDRPHRSLKQAAPLKAIPAPVSDLKALRGRRTRPHRRRHPRLPARRMTRIAFSAPAGAQRQLHCAKSCRIEPASALPRTM